MAPQGHDAGATSREGACENSNLERQGCSPFYQEVTDDPYVDPVSGLRPVGICKTFAVTDHTIVQFNAPSLTEQHRGCEQLVT